MNNLFQLGVTIVFLIILFFILRYFVNGLNKRFGENSLITTRLSENVQASIDASKKLSNAIDINTKQNQENSDKLTALILQLLKEK